MQTGDPQAALEWMLHASHLAQPRDLPGILTRAARMCGCRDAHLFLIDYDHLRLVSLEEPETVISVEGTLAGRAFADVSTQSRAEAGGTTAWIPVVDGTERLGVVRFDLSRDGDLDVLMPLARAIASLMAFLLLSKSAVGDLIELVRRRLPMSLPAEMQWRLLPPLTYATDDLVISGVVLPTNDVAGDSFDYSVNGSTVHVSVLDAMGHGLDATLQASVAVGALRNARRTGLSLLDTVRSTDSVLARAFGESRFVTGVVGELDLHTGVWSWVSAGHPPALLIRGARVVKQLETGRTTPLGLLLDAPESVGQERLEPGDRLLFHTDGVVEARSAEGKLFGSDRLVDFVVRQLADGRPAPETLRRLNLAILEHQHDELQDDATTVLVEWRGTGQRALQL